jgi:uncharacterized protein DUF695
VLRWFRRKRPQAEAPEHWTLARSDEDGKPVAFRFRSIVPAGVRTADYPHLINIYWRFDGTDTNGMPTPELYDRMARLETLLEAIEGPGLGYLVLSITGNGRKEWIWYVADKDRYMARVNEVFSREAEPFPVEFESAPDPDWNSYTVLLRVRGSDVH